jgi:hypothetical protein
MKVPLAYPEETPQSIIRKFRINELGNVLLKCILSCNFEVGLCSVSTFEHSFTTDKFCSIPIAWSLRVCLRRKARHLKK